MKLYACPCIQTGGVVIMKKILVPVDFSEFSDRAVDYALFLGKKFCAQVLLLHVIALHTEEPHEEEHMQSYEELIEKKEKRHARKLDDHCKIARDRGIDIDSDLIRGVSPAETILDYIIDNKFDLVVIGTHGRTGITQWLFGSVAERVVRHSLAPVITVHKEWNKQKIDHLLIPVDFSEHSRKAVEKGKEWAEMLDAKVSLMHVVEQERHPEFYSTSFKSIFEVNPQLKSKIEENLLKFSGFKKDDVKIIMLEGKAHKEIADYIEEHRVDLVIMGTRGYNPLDHLLLGSNAERVVRLAKCPVLTVSRKK